MSFHQDKHRGSSPIEIANILLRNDLLTDVGVGVEWEQTEDGEKRPRAWPEEVLLGQVPEHLKT